MLVDEGHRVSVEARTISVRQRAKPEISGLQAGEDVKAMSLLDRVLVIVPRI
jgi:hypothetical protein